MNTLYYRCSCPHCSQDIEYVEEYSAQVIDCPSCHQALTLPEKPYAKSKTSMFGALLTKLQDARQEKRDKRELKKLLFDGVADGVLTDDELAQIRSFVRETGLHESDFQEWGRVLFTRAVESLKPETLSPERLDSIEHIKSVLRLNDDAAPREMQRLNRLRYILEIRQGRIPPVWAENVILRAGETAYWFQPGRLWESRVVSRRYEGGSTGMSFRIAKGITLRTSGMRGQLVTDSADVPVSEGNFIITNRRFIFQGLNKSFESKFEKILDINNHIDGIRFSESNRQKPRKIEYSAPNGDIVVEILSKVFSPASGI